MRSAASLVCGAVLVALTAALGASGSAPADSSAGACAGPLTPAGLAQLPGPPLRFGISPNVQAGQVGPAESAQPDDPARDLAALEQLRGPAPFVLRLTRLFWADGETGIDQFLALARRYTAAGFQVELQLRYQPPAGHDGDIAGWVAWVREVVDRFGPDPGVVGLQVTNEVNFSQSPDSSDGSYAGARDALIAGVIAAKQEARAQGFQQLRIGFNWFYRTDPADDQSFWIYLGQHGGAAFAAAVDWVGLDAYPGTFFPPSEPTGGFADGIVNALSVLRNCYMPMAGLGAAVPIQIEENGYPTGPGRSDQTQVEALQEMVGAVNAYRGTFNVSDYRWFNLRDADSSSSNFQQQFGLLNSDYTPKPAFALYHRLVLGLGAGPAGASTPASGAGRRSRRARLTLLVSDRRGAAVARCLRPPVSLTVASAPGVRVRRMTVTIAGRRLIVRRRAPFRVRLPSGSLSKRPRVVSVRVLARGPLVRVLSRRLRTCGPAAAGGSRRGRVVR